MVILSQQQEATIHHVILNQLCTQWKFWHKHTWKLKLATVVTATVTTNGSVKVKSDLSLTGKTALQLCTNFQKKRCTHLPNACDVRETRDCANPSRTCPY